MSKKKYDFLLFLNEVNNRSKTTEAPQTHTESHKLQISLDYGWREKALMKIPSKHISVEYTTPSQEDESEREREMSIISIQIRLKY